MQSTASWRRRSLLAVVLAVLAGLLPTGVAQGAEGGPKLTVMTRNLYLGTGLDNVVTAGSFPAFVSAVTQDWANVVATDFPARADALAGEIAGARPDFVGLQEVSLWRDQVGSDIVLGHTAPNATHVVYDFLAILQAELAERGIPYVAVSTSTNADVEAPRLDPTSPNGFTDVRLTDRDVILVRAGLAGKTSNPLDGHYAAQLTLPSAGGPVTFTRGWASIDYRHDARTTVRVFDTHLEVEVPPAGAVQVLQGAEALALITASPYPVVALGDFNSAADGSTTPTYAALTAVLSDAWVTAHPGDPGLTCCQNELLSNTTSQAHSRIDLVLTTEPWPVDRVSRTGDQPFRAGPAPVWGSDHFGVTARITITR
jgi:endonuclease/exonuclease/phosphatase family metal-dependent hydrolase